MKDYFPYSHVIGSQSSDVVQHPYFGDWKNINSEIPTEVVKETKKSLVITEIYY